MPDFKTQYETMSPEGQRLFKQGFRERYKTMAPKEQDTILSRISGIRELEELTLEPTAAPPTDIPMWQKPFKWIHEEVEQPFAAAALSPFTPAISGTEGMGWMEKERAEYEAAELPWGVKGLTEFMPWLAIPSAAGIAGKLGGLAAKGGAIGRAAELGVKAMKPAVAAEALPGKMIGKGISKVREKAYGKPGEFMALAPNELIDKQITKDDWMRRVAQWFGRKPVFKPAVRAIGGEAALIKGGERAFPKVGEKLTPEMVEDVTARALIVQARAQESLTMSGIPEMAKLDGIIMNFKSAVGVTKTTQLCTRVKAKPGYAGASKAAPDVWEHPYKYIFEDSRVPKYIDEADKITKKVADALRREGVDFKELPFDEFSHWVHRVVLGKVVDGKYVELSKGLGRAGAKQSWQKTRFYEVAEEGINKGLVYDPSLRNVVDLYTRSAAKIIADKRMATILEPFGEKFTERAWARAPEVMKTAKETALILASANRLEKVILRAMRGEKLPPATLAAQEHRLPTLGAKLREASANKAKLKTLLKETKALQQVSKEPYWKAKAARTKVMEAARTPSYGKEATIMHPAFQGKIYPAEVASELNRYWGDLGHSTLNKAATMSGAMRMLVAAADFSAMFIQGLPGIALHPTSWGKGAAMSFKSFKDPKLYSNYLVREATNIQERVFYGGYAGGFEYMEAMKGLQRAAARIAGKKGEVAIRQSYGRFEAAFGSFGDVARNEMWKAMKGRMSAEQLPELARHLDRMTGVMSMKGIGIGKTQSQLESGFVYFAPRYTRAGFSLVGDVFKGGLTGAEARKALGSMMAAGAAFYTGTCLALGQEPNFDPKTGKFMTVEITDPLTGTTRHFGIGGMMTSLVRFAADVSYSAMGVGEASLKDFITLSRYDNPFLRFMYSKAAPLTGFIGGLIEKKNYFGEPFENPGDYAKFLAEQVTPIALQAMLMEEGGIAPTTFIAEEAGMRTFPRSDWEKRDDIRDRLAMEKYGVDWDTLGEQKGKASQLQVERDSPELQEASALAQESSRKMARGEGKVWDSWHSEGDLIEETYRKAVTLAAKEYEATRDGYMFRQKVDDISNARRAQYAIREKKPEYKEVYDYFSEPLEPEAIEKMNPKDLARRQYYKAMYSPDMYDQYGNYNFDEADKRESLFTQQFGQEALDYVKEYRGAKWTEPMAVRALRDAREILRPYWDVEDQVWSQYSPELRAIANEIEILDRTDPQAAKRYLRQYPQIMRAWKMVQYYRKMIKSKSPDIQRALNLFYSR